MNPNEIILYKILIASTVNVQIHAEDKSVWRLTPMQPVGTATERLKPADLLMVAKCALQIWVTVTTDPFLDLELLETENDALIIHVKS